MTAWESPRETRAKGKRLQLQCEKIQLTISHGKAVFALWKWYGRTGNNIQQLIVVIAHAEAFGGSFQLDEAFISIGPLRGIVDAFKLDFATNPYRTPKHLLSGYRVLPFSKAIIVTEPGSTHVLMDSVQSLFPDHELVHGSANDDFQLLRHSVNLASSGVGTFAIAAVLLSQNIKQFHCTDVFQIEHLNPLMIDAAKVNVRMLQLHGYADQWLRAQNRRDLLLNWRPRPQV